MRFARWFCFCLCLCAAAVPAISQEPETAESEKQRKISILLGEVVTDAGELRLPENRAFIYASLGNIAWARDPAAAKALFDKAISELISAQNLAESTRKTAAAANDLLTGQTLRPQLLNIIARRDAEAALDALTRTRPAAITEAMQYQPGKSQKFSSYANNNYLAAGELNLEQSFIRMAAEQKPERAAKLLKDSIRKGVSGETLTLLKRLHEKDPAAASVLAAEAVDKVIRGKFLTPGGQPDSNAVSAATSFLSDFIRERSPTDRSFSFDDTQMRTLADRLIAFHLDQGANYGYYVGTVIQIAEKLSPGAVDRLKAAGRNYRGFGEGQSYDTELQKLIGSDVTPEQLMAQASKFPAASQQRLYQAAAQRYASTGNSARARQVIEEHFSDSLLESSLQSLDWQQISTLENDGKFAEAERLIDEMPEINRISALINLATAAFGRDEKENRTYSVALLAKARQVIGDTAGNSNEMNNLIQIVSAYSRIDEREAFAMMNSIMPQINEVTDAAVVTSQFQGNSSIRQKEIVMVYGNSFGVYLDYSVFNTLIKKDFDRTLSLVNGFSRVETRIKLKLQLAESGLN